MRSLRLFFLILGLFLASLLSVTFAGVAQAAETPAESTETSKTGQVTITAFVRAGCQHCADEEAFLAKLQTERSDIAIKYYRLENPEERKIWEDFTARTGSAKVTPLTLIGNTLITGFDKEDTTGQQFIAAIEQAKAQGIDQKPLDITAVSAQDLKAGATAATCPEDGSAPCVIPGHQPVYVTVPFIGQLNVQSYPLLALSAILGFIDGFNPCAMWVLVTFSMMLMQVGSRKKMALFIGTFVLAEAIMYYLIMTVWFKTWDFVQLDQIVTPIIGTVAIGSGLFFLYEWRKEKAECAVTDMDQRQKIRSRIKDLATRPFTVMTFLGILGLAFSVNVIEFACSIGIPQTFTKVLELNNLSWMVSQGYILVYILMYMIDDFIVFGIAMLAIDKMHLTSKYSKFSNLIGGVLMVALGLILIFKREWLLF
jgi:cytochrome c biogenesis protein CcdA/glutaredoxin